MKRNFTLLLLSTAILSTGLLSCRRKCASAEGAGTDVWLGETHIIAPSAFTPFSEDHINDRFSFIRIVKPDAGGEPPQIAAPKIKDFGMEIRRGGELLFETYTWGGSWDGKTPKGKKVDGLVDVEYRISDFDGNVSEGTFKLFVVPPGCLQECMRSHVFADMIDPNVGVAYPTKENFCQ